MDDLANDGSQENALEMVELIEDEAKRSWPLSVIAKSFIEAGRLDKALETARKIKHESLLSITLAGVAAGFARKGENDTARGLLKEAISIARRITDIAEREDAFSSLIPKLAGSGLMDEASALTDSLANKNAFERKGGIDSIAQAMAEAGKTSEALKLLRSYGSQILFPHDSVVAIVEKLAQAGKMNEVFAIRNDIPFPNTIDQPIVEGLIKAGKIDDAITVAQNIEDEDGRFGAFAEAAEFLLHSGSYRQARLTADRCPSPLERLHLYLEIFNEISFKRNPQLSAQLKKYFE